jgi:hypothetical protein
MSEMTADWVGFVAVFGAAILVTLGTMVWILFFRKNKRRRRKRRRRQDGSPQLNPTLAQIGGMPAARHDETLPKPPPTPMSPS